MGGSGGGGTIQVWMFHPMCQAPISNFFSSRLTLASAHHPRGQMRLLTILFALADFAP